MIPLKYIQLSSIGDRAINQDCMAGRVGRDYALFMVADGLGGHHAGEKASRFFCRGIFLLLEKYQPLLKTSPEQVFTHWIDEAVGEMRRQFGDDPFAEKAHTTCAILYLDAQQVITAHCGDSRVYRLNPERVLWRTRDHSMTQQLLDDGILTEREMGLHPEQNQLTRSINILNRHQADIRIYPPIRKNETFVLCSDGFWEFIKENELLQLAQREAGEEELKKYIKLTAYRAAGNSDNITVQLIKADI